MSGRRPRPGADVAGAPRLGDLLSATLLVPIRSSDGSSPDAADTPSSAFRHGTDATGSFLGAYTSAQVLADFGPPGTDHVPFPARELFARAADGAERIVIDHGSPAQVEVPVGVLPFLAAGIDPASANAMASRRPHAELPRLERPADIPEPFGEALRITLAELPHVERAWLLRAGEAWTVGVELASDASLADFDAVRNRLHTLATEHLGSRRDLIVTDLRAPSVREAYAAVSAPFHVAGRKERRGFLSRLLGGG